MLFIYYYIISHLRAINLNGLSTWFKVRSFRLSSVTLLLCVASEINSLYGALSLRLFYEVRTTGTSYESHNCQIQVPFMAQRSLEYSWLRWRGLFNLVVLSNRRYIDISSWSIVFCCLSYIWLCQKSLAHVVFVHFTIPERAKSLICHWWTLIASHLKNTIALIIWY